MSLTKEITDKKVNFEFNKEFINVFNKKIKDNDTEFLAKTLKELHPADSADIIENLVSENRSKLIELEGFNIDPKIFVELNESIQTEIFLLLSIESIASLLKKLESDDALKILENLDQSKKETVLNRLPPKDRFLLEESLSYPEDTAARIMQREFTAIPSNWVVGQTIDYLRENKDLPEEFLEIFIVDSNFKPIGTVPSSKVLRTSKESKMNSIMNETQVLIPVKMDKEEVGHIFENYNLVSAGVVDKENKLVGMITGDDVFTVLKEEAEEDVLRLAGVGDEEITDSILKKTKDFDKIGPRFGSQSSKKLSESGSDLVKLFSFFCFLRHYYHPPQFVRFQRFHLITPVTLLIVERKIQSHRQIHNVL